MHNICINLTNSLLLGRGWEHQKNEQADTQCTCHTSQPMGEIHNKGDFGTEKYNKLHHEGIRLRFRS